MQSYFNYKSLQSDLGGGGRVMGEEGEEEDEFSKKENVCPICHENKFVSS